MGSSQYSQCFLGISPGQGNLENLGSMLLSYGVSPDVDSKLSKWQKFYMLVRLLVNYQPWSSGIIG